MCILIVFGIFFISSAAYRMVRLRNERMTMKAADEEADLAALKAEPALEASITEECVCGGEAGASPFAHSETVGGTYGKKHQTSEYDIRIFYGR